MTTLNTTFERPKAIPGFSCLKMKEEIQAKIYEETKDMTTEEWLAYVRRGAARLDAEQRLRREELAE